VSFQQGCDNETFANLAARFSKLPYHGLCRLNGGSFDISLIPLINRRNHGHALELLGHHDRRHKSSLDGRSVGGGERSGSFNQAG
jgi:hypothetical protein